LLRAIVVSLGDGALQFTELARVGIINQILSNALVVAADNSRESSELGVTVSTPPSALDRTGFCRM